MFAIVVLCALAALTSASSDQFFSAKFNDVPIVPRDDEFIRQAPFSPKLDHFRPQDERTVDFTYTINTEFYTPDGPIFVFVDDAVTYTDEWIRAGLVYDIARETGGALVTASHRYFGNNIPTATTSFEDLAFLTVDQALADVATLIGTVIRDLEVITPRVVVWGTGYGATIAVMARKKYPHLVHGVWASSGLFGARVVDTGYYENLSTVIRYSGSVECAERLHNAFDVLEYLIENAEVAYLQERLRLCSPLATTDEQEVAVLMYRFIDLISQYIRVHNLNGLNNFCNDMHAYEADTLNSLIRWIEYVYGGSPDCVNINYADTIAAMQETTFGNGLATQQRLLTYLRCTQTGGLKVDSSFVFDIFPDGYITEEYQFRFCEDVLGENYQRTGLERAIEELNFVYGGQDQIITHVIFSNAGLNPLLHFGIAEYDQVYSDVVFLTYSSAGADLRSISNADSVDLYNAKVHIDSFIRRWINADPR